MLLAWTPDRQSVVYTLSIDNVVMGDSVEMAQEHEEMGRLKIHVLKMGELTQWCHMPNNCRLSCLRMSAHS